MADNKPKKQVVSTRVVIENGKEKVILSKTRENTLAMIKDAKARADLRTQWEKKALESYHRTNKPFTMGVAEGGRHVYVAGQGSFRAAVFSRQGGLELIRQLAEFKRLLASLPNGEEDTSEEDVDLDA